MPYKYTGNCSKLRVIQYPEEYNLAKLTPPINNTVYKRIG